MKKTLALLIALMMLFTLTACGGGNTSDTPDTPDTSQSGENTDDKINAEDIVEDALDNAEEVNSFSVEAVERFFSTEYGLDLAAVEPDWEWELKHEYAAYGDTPDSGYGHGSITFTKKDGEVSEDEYKAWLEKVFAATASVSQDGYNVIGYEFIGEGEDALSETTLEAAMDGFMQGWAFRCNDSMNVVYVSQEYDNEKESTTGSLFYYDGVSVDIGSGLDKSFGETMGDLEDYFEENEDEIADALEDFME